MLIKHQILPGAISEILVSARETGVLTLADRYGLMAATLDEHLTEEDERSMNRLLRSVIKGKVKISPEISAVYYSPYPTLFHRTNTVYVSPKSSVA
ncbi:hypothetical protein BI308_07160 [Roseofilum reptotaenium AO1-A]|uniref:Uncharacterized protein n=1 Tax=Roseofilum reptotaenium AO1-A TaxID=1925591 RepID=A0A1L9QUN0_9CYAN|nr:hypothetical protein [Roseofilum reptotaenium]OJJ26381.1 hypothetical protein BI308_07160 [Roseofilum reptotaenium AO1-A]